MRSPKSWARKDAKRASLFATQMIDEWSREPTSASLVCPSRVRDERTGESEKYIHIYIYLFMGISITITIYTAACVGYIYV